MEKTKETALDNVTEEHRIELVEKIVGLKNELEDIADSSERSHKQAVITRLEHELDRLETELYRFPEKKHAA